MNLWSEKISLTRDEESVKALIESFQSLNLAVVDYDAIHLIVQQILEGWAKRDRGWRLNKVFRARKNTNGSFGHTSELGAPGARSISKFGRLNKVGQPTLYAAEKSIVALWEIRPADGDRVTITEFEPIEEIEVSILDLAVYESECAGFLGYKKSINSVREEIERLGSGYSYVKQITEFIVKEMKKVVESGNEYEYKTTAAIADILWRSNDRHPVILYPSITRNLNGTNLAFDPKYFYEKYQIIHIHEIEIVKVEMDKIQYKTLKMKANVDANGFITWTEGPDAIHEVGH